MKTFIRNGKRRAGYVSILMVLATGSVLSVLMIYAYRRAVAAQAIQSEVQLRVDYSEKEEAILRSIVTIMPNRAIRAMQSGSNGAATVKDPLRWQNIFTESLVLANARTSISPALLSNLNIPNLQRSNTGDSALGNPAEIFRAISPDTGYVSVGNNRSLGNGYPPPLSIDTSISTTDAIYPIITAKKTYGSLASAGVGLSTTNYPNFNLLKYPKINFGYAKPGDDFVAKRNWWAFSVDVADNDDNLTRLARNKRNFVLSLYEIPSQLSISAASFMSLGQYASGEAWQNVTIDGGVFAGRAETLGNTPLTALASRRGMTLSSGTTVDGKTMAASPFAPGVRETFLATQGDFFPVSLPSESGKAVFIPINRGVDFFDRFGVPDDINTLSATTWNDYTIGAKQAAMQLDIVEVESATNRTPTKLRFRCLKAGNTTGIPTWTDPDYIVLGVGTLPTLPRGFVKIAEENASYTFTRPVDVAYGKSGGYSFKNGVSGKVDFNNASFGDPLVGTVKEGYWRERAPYERKTLPGNGQSCITVYPERLPAYVSMLGGAPVGETSSGAAVVGPFGSRLLANKFYNNSIVVNVDYTSSGLNNATKYKPGIPCSDTMDYGLIMRECSNMTAFSKGFSLVTNLRLYVGDDFNVVSATPPAGYTPLKTASNPTGRYLPPCSLFTPELRYGVEVDPYAILVGGQIGSLSKLDKVQASDADAAKVRPLDSKNLSGQVIASDKITVNLSQIRHPAELPPISMMNWLIVLEERRKEFY